MANVGFGLIGFGAWGSHHARVIAAGSETELVAVADSSEKRRDEAAAAHPKLAVFVDYRQMLDCADVAAVSIALPSHLHHAAGRRVLEAGKHLLLEKPMALTIEDCRDLVQLAADRGLHVAVAHQFRYSGLWGKIKQLLDDGAIGDLHYAMIELWRNPYRQGEDGWRYDIERVGDWILEEPIHFFDLARWYFSAAGEPSTVYARANARDPNRPRLQDNFTAIVNFPRGGFAVIAQTLAGFEHHQVVRLTGSTGALWATWSGAVDRSFHPTYSLKHFDGEQIHDVPISGKPGEVYELADVVDDLAAAIRANRPPRVTGEDGLKSVSMCLKAQESVAKQSVVTL
jgi:myo-inositol 2-dehydrogenase / D-chiro-inositol 1-dehydrogenase